VVVAAFAAVIVAPYRVASASLDPPALAAAAAAASAAATAAAAAAAATAAYRSYRG
jgi:hypothetical protein